MQPTTSYSISGKPCRESHHGPHRPPYKMIGTDAHSTAHNDTQKPRGARTLPTLRATTPNHPNSNLDTRANIKLPPYGRMATDNFRHLNHPHTNQASIPPNGQLSDQLLYRGQPASVQRRLQRRHCRLRYRQQNPREQSHHRRYQLLPLYRLLFVHLSPITPSSPHPYISRLSLTH